MATLWQSRGLKTLSLSPYDRTGPTTRDGNTLPIHMTALNQSPSTSTVNGSKSHASLYPEVMGILCYLVADNSIKVREWKASYVNLVELASKVYVWAKTKKTFPVHRCNACTFPTLRLLINAASIEKYQLICPTSSEFLVPCSDNTASAGLKCQAVLPGFSPVGPQSTLFYKEREWGWCSIVQEERTQTELTTLLGI